MTLPYCWLLAIIPSVMHRMIPNLKQFRRVWHIKLINFMSVDYGIRPYGVFGSEIATYGPIYVKFARRRKPLVSSVIPNLAIIDGRVAPTGRKTAKLSRE